MQSKRIVITDVGTISSLGTGFESLNEAMTRTPQKSTVKDYDFHQLENDIECYSIKDYDPVQILGKKGLRNKDFSTKILLGTIQTGFEEILSNTDEYNKPGISIGTAFGSIQSIGDFLSDSIINGVNSVNPQLFANTVINSPTGNANIRFNSKNLSSTIASGFNAGIDSLIYSYNYLRKNYIQNIIAGGLEEISYYALLGLLRSGMLSNSGDPRPFAADANGVIMGEACALFLMESEESANERGARIIAEIAGTASSFDPQAAQNGKSDGESGAFAIKTALEEAEIDADAIDFIASGANGNPKCDKFEAAAIKKVMDTKTPVTAYKMFTGECYGASGAMNVACALSDLKNKKISGKAKPYQTIDDIPLVFEPQNKESTYALVTSFSCEGNCSVVILKNVN